MKETHIRKIWWATTFLYVIFIYTTLGIAPGIWDKVNSLLGGKNNLILCVIYSIAGASLFLYITLIKKEKSIAKYLILAVFVGAFLVMLKFAKLPIEKIHIGMYGLLGVLLYNALKIDLARTGVKLYLYAALIAITIVFIDEVIQGVLPNRVFDWRDIFMGAVSSILALLVIRINILKE